MLASELDIANLIKGLSKGLNFGLLDSYVPHPLQAKFHADFGLPERFFFGGNRSGKTYSHLAELLWIITGTHPCFTPIEERDPESGFWYNLRETWKERGWAEAPKPEDWPYIPRPRGSKIYRWIGNDWDVVYNVHFAVIRKLLPDRYLKGGSWDTAFSKQWHRLEFSEELDSAILEFKTYAQFKNDPYSHDSQTLDWVGFDEEPPEKCFIINQARMSTTGGGTTMSLTLASGCEWIPQQIIDKGQDDPNKAVYFMEIWDNPYIDKMAAERFLDKIADPSERLAREKGVPIYYAGRVFSQYNDDHFIDTPIGFYENYKTAPFTIAIDPHDSKPTFVLGTVWDIEGDEPVAYACYENSIRGSIGEVTNQIRVDLAELGFKPDLWIIDRSSKRVSQLHTGNYEDTIFDEWRTHIPALLPVGGAGTYDKAINTMHEMLNVDSATGNARAFVLKTCPGLDWQMRNYRYKSKTAAGEDRKYETVHKKNDDWVDCWRYAIGAEPPMRNTLPKVAQVIGFAGYGDAQRRVI